MVYQSSVHPPEQLAFKACHSQHAVLLTEAQLPVLEDLQHDQLASVYMQLVIICVKVVTNAVDGEELGELALLENRDEASSIHDCKLAGLLTSSYQALFPSPVITPQQARHLNKVSYGTR